MQLQLVLLISLASAFIASAKNPSRHLRRLQDGNGKGGKGGKGEKYPRTMNCYGTSKGPKGKGKGKGGSKGPTASKGPKTSKAPSSKSSGEPCSTTVCAEELAAIPTCIQENIEGGEAQASCAACVASERAFLESQPFPGCELAEFALCVSLSTCLEAGCGPCEGVLLAAASCSLIADYPCPNGLICGARL